MTDATVPGTISAPGQSRPENKRARKNRQSFLRALLFMLPALVLLGALVVAPIFSTIDRSLYDRSGNSFVGLDNYSTILHADNTRRALKNNLIWVIFAPSIATALGLIFAVLSERVRWQTAFKVAVFMPMAISFLAAGVIFRVVYEGEPRQGLANAMLNSVHEIVKPSGIYNGVHPVQGSPLTPEGEGYVTVDDVTKGQKILMPMVGLPVDRIPSTARVAGDPVPPAGGVSGVVWLDFTRGGGGVTGQRDPTEVGLSGIPVVLKDAAGKKIAETSTKDDGSWTIDDLSASGPVRVHLGQSVFRPPYGGVEWLGPSLITASVIGAYVWIWAGFAMIVIGAGLAAMPREVIEAARVDGASEWQVFRRVTVPLLMPTLMVVLITLTINVLKIFDLILIIPPGSSQDDATVIAFEMWAVSFGGAQDQGLGSALSVVLFVLVLPAMLFNIRRFKSGDA